MGMQNSDNEEQIMNDHAMEEAYKKLFPWDKKPKDEEGSAHWSHKVKELLTNPKKHP